MRGQDVVQGSMFSYVDIEQRIPASHPLRKVKIVVDGILRSMSDEFDRRYSWTGRPSIPPEHLLRALMLQVLYTIRSERQLVEQLDYNLLFRWFVGLGVDDVVWERTVFCANRDRLLEQTLLRQFFDRVLGIADWAGLVSDEHFSVDGTMIEAWASHKSFVRLDDNDHKDPPEGPGSRNAEVDFKAERRSNKTHVSTTDPDAKLYKKAQFAESKLRHLTHILSENRNGLVVDVETTQANGHAEREAAEKMAARRLESGATLGADKGYDASPHIKKLQAIGVTPHIAAKRTGSAVPESIKATEGYAISLRKRKRIEECFGWAKTAGGFRKTRFIGTAKVQAQALLVFAAYNLTRMIRLCGWNQPISAA
jgi:transposase